MMVLFEKQVHLQKEVGAGGEKVLVWCYGVFGFGDAGAERSLLLEVYGELGWCALTGCSGK
jgi:hypothetical protein